MLRSLRHRSRQLMRRPSAILQQEAPRSWAVAAGCCLLHLLLYGAARLAGLMLVALVDEFRVTRAQAALASSLATCLRSFAGLFVGTLGNRFGLQPVIATGVSMASLGVGVCYFAPDITWINVAWGGIFGVGCGLALGLVPVAINQHFGKHSGIAFGISYSGAYMGSFLFPPLVYWLLNNYQLAGTFLISAAFILNGLPAAMLFKPPKPPKVPPPLSAITTNASPLETVRELNENSDVELDVNNKGGQLPEKRVDKDICGNDRNHQSKPPSWLSIRLAKIRNFFLWPFSAGNVKSDIPVATVKDVKLHSVLNLQNLDRQIMGKKCRSGSHLNHKNSLNIIAERFPSAERKNELVAKCHVNFAFSFDQNLSGNNDNETRFPLTLKPTLRSGPQSRDLRVPSIDLPPQNNSVSDNESSFHKEPSDVFQPPLIKQAHVTTDPTAGSLDARISEILTTSVKLDDHQSSGEPKTLQPLSPKSQIGSSDLISIPDQLSKSMTLQNLLPKSTKGISETLIELFAGSLRMYRSWLFCVIAATAALHSFILVCVITIIEDFQKDVGIAEECVHYALMVLSGVDLLSALTLGFVTDKALMTPCNFVSLCFAGMGLCCVWMVQCGSLQSLLPAVAAYGVFETGSLITQPLLWKLFVRTAKQPVALPAVNILSAPTVLLVPLVIGYFRDRLGSYHGVFYVLSATAFLLSTLWLIVPRIGHRGRTSLNNRGRGAHRNILPAVGRK